jgi:hypothetical protein
MNTKRGNRTTTRLSTGWSKRIREINRTSAASRPDKADRMTLASRAKWPVVESGKKVTKKKQCKRR